ncbi:DUF4188 domain-containing protein [Gordonia sp. CPCC 205333]|uniref:DUF4188 domain-containing protein n=1 Tax=Gordonia sp. CPCC 205333 TaxID=3140790 RepID=UPI003AF39D3A
MGTVRTTTHNTDQPIVVFLIGFRINNPLRLKQWIPVFTAMPRMLRELDRDPASGLLHYQLALQPRGAMVVQYWRSVDELYRYARDADHKHWPAWKAFYARATAAPDAVGIWHETYDVPAGNAESIYGAMPVTGLAAATSSEPVTAATRSAKQRMRRRVSPRRSGPASPDASDLGNTVAEDRT